MPEEQTEGFVRNAEYDGQWWRVKWNPKGQLSGAGRGLERKITISCSPESGAVQHLEIASDEIADVDAFRSLSVEQVRNLIRRSDTRTWTDPSGRTWEISIALPPGAAMATDGKLGDASTLYIRFTDPTNRGRHPSVPYTSGKSLGQLTDEEIAVYWDQVVDKYPDLASA